MKGKRKILMGLVCAGIMFIALISSKYLGFSEGMFKIFIGGIGVIFSIYCGLNVLKSKIDGGSNDTT